MKALTAALAVPWAIRPETLQLILDIAARSHLPDFEESARRLSARHTEIEGVSAAPGKPLDGTRHVQMRGNVAVLPIEGPMFRYASIFSAMSGATSIESLAKDLRVAANDPDVKAILLHVDSPGGEVNGTGEFADMIYATRGVKPVWAYVSHEGASAAYWIASAADKIVCAPTSLIGSIGVVAAVPDPNSPSHQNGRIEFVSSQSPKKRPDPTSDEGKAQIQAVIDDIAEQFIATVARNRSVDADTVLAKYGAGSVLVGQKAVDAGLADEVGSFEQALVDIAGAVTPAKRPAVTANATTRGANALNVAVEYPATTAGTATVDLADFGSTKQADASEESTDEPEVPAGSSREQKSAAPSSGDKNTGTSAGRKSHMSKAWDRLVAAIQGVNDEEDVEDTGVEAVASPSVPELRAATRESSRVAADNSAVVQENRQLRDRAISMEAELRKLQAERIQERAEAFIHPLIPEGRITPAEEAAWTEMYVRLANDDATLALEGGTTRVQALERALLSRPKNMLSSEQVPEALNALILNRHNMSTAMGPGALSRITPEGQSMSEERRKELLSKTDIGQEVLRHRNGNGRNN